MDNALGEPVGVNRWKASERLYLDRSKQRVCREGDVDAAYLLVPAGGEITIERAIELGLMPRPEYVMTAPRLDIAPEPAPAKTEAPAAKTEQAAKPATQQDEVRTRRR